MIFIFSSSNDYWNLIHEISLFLCKKIRPELKYASIQYSGNESEFCPTVFKIHHLNQQKIVFRWYVGIFLTRTKSSYLHKMKIMRTKLLLAFLRSFVQNFPSKISPRLTSKESAKGCKNFSSHSAKSLRTATPNKNLSIKICSPFIIDYARIYIPRLYKFCAAVNFKPASLNFHFFNKKILI